MLELHGHQPGCLFGLKKGDMGGVSVYGWSAQSGTLAKRCEIVSLSLLTRVWWGCFHPRRSSSPWTCTEHRAEVSLPAPSYTFYTSFNLTSHGLCPKMMPVTNLRFFKNPPRYSARRVTSDVTHVARKEKWVTWLEKCFFLLLRHFPDERIHILLPGQPTW